LSELDICVSQTNVVTPQIYWAGIPGGESQYPSEMTFLTFLEPASCFIHPETCAKPSEISFGIKLCDRLNAIPLKVDISDLPMKKSLINNRNKFILGPSGSGKSFFTNHLVRQYYEQDAHVVIVDVGDSYLGLCKMINEETGGKDGVYYTYTEETPVSFNPFFVKDNIYTIEKKEQLSSLIFCLWKSETENITKAEETHISTAINDFIELIVSKNTTPSFTNFYKFLKKDFKRKLQDSKVERENFDIENLLQVLRPYSEGGMYDYLLNATENIDLLEKRFIVFEIDNIKDHKTLFPVVTLILMDTFISKMRHPSLGQTRKLILIEEAWKAISKAGTAEFIKYLFKTVRKHFGEAIVVTQEIEDIIGNEVVKNSILGNADCKILLDQRKYANSFDEIAQILGLTEKDVALALSLNRMLDFSNRSPYKEVFITLNGNNSRVYALEVSKQEYLVYTTEKTEKSKLMELEKQTGSIRSAINEYINLNF
jgi:conjugation system TraG family ATPase